MSEKKPNYREGAIQAAKNIAAAGAGSYIGYQGGGLIAKQMLKSKSFRNKVSRMTPKQRRKFLNRVGLAGAAAGMAAGGLSSYALSEALNKSNDKTASFFINYAYSRLV